MTADRHLLPRMLVQVALLLGLIGALLFLGARTWRWPGGWGFILLFGAWSAGISLWLLRRDPGLLRERMTLPVRDDQSAEDKRFLLVVGVLWFGWLCAMGRDAARHGFAAWPGAVQAIGALLVSAGFLVTAWTFAANSFASPAVRLQRERGQHLVDTGPYALVRHPMYGGGLLTMLGMPLQLGSPWGLLAVPVFAWLLGRRTRWEEATLRAGLPGYAAYAARVRRRFVPGLW